MSFLLDTCVISELISKQPNPTVVSWLDQLDPDDLYLSVVTIGEIRKGIEKLPASKRRETLEGWLRDELLVRFHNHILNIDVEVILVWGALVGRLESAGQRMPAIDSMIAAIALHHRVRLVTRNENDFRHANINLINPWSFSE